ncbi:MAG: hypothetical protein H6737_31505 [Alphaproteobacteria bacterium]|nr:hypothetical protein [Alphaproteobacteria bacterium]
MNRQELVQAVLSTAEDHRLSRGERRALREVFEAADLAEPERLAARQDVVHAVAAQMRDPADRALVEWLARALSLFDDPGAGESPSSRAWFGPEDPMAEELVGFVAGARRSIEVAVFTITDDRVADALIAAHARGVNVRILTDDDKSEDRGSDVDRLERAGIAVRHDRSPYHFHHKFAVFDGERLLNGSYNWTRGAANDNRENFLLTWEPRLVRAYSMAFEKLWAELG